MSNNNNQTSDNRSNKRPYDQPLFDERALPTPPSTQLCGILDQVGIYKTNVISPSQLTREEWLQVCACRDYSLYIELYADKDARNRVILVNKVKSAKMVCTPVGSADSVVRAVTDFASVFQPGASYYSYQFS